jgi:hypothetical protein
MERASVVPNRYIVFTPLEPYLRVVILSDDIEEVGKQNVGFVF